MNPSPLLERAASDDDIAATGVDNVNVALYKNHEQEMDKMHNASAVYNNNVYIQRYTRVALCHLRNDCISRRAPECAQRTDLQMLGFWKISTGNGHPISNRSSNNVSSNESGTVPSNSGLQSSGGHINTRIQNSPSARNGVIAYCSLPTKPTASGSALPNHTTSTLHHPIHKNYIDHRSISSAHLMPAFAKRKIAVTTQNTVCGGGNAGGTTDCDSATSVMYGGNSPASDLRSATPADNKDHHDSNYAPIRQRSREQPIRDFRQRTSTDDHQTSTAGFLSPQRKQYVTDDHERCERLDRSHDQEHGTGGGTYAVSVSHSRHGRIGSGRLLPRDANWDYRGAQDKEKSASNTASTSEHIPPHRSANRFSERTMLHERSGNGSFIERRSFDRRGGNGGPSASSNDDHVREKLENIDTNSNSQNTRRYPNEVTSSNMESLTQSSMNHPHGNQHQHHPPHQQQPQNARNRRYNQYNDRNEEPEWFSSGPTSQNDTIELRGFEEIDDQHSGNGTKSSGTTVTRKLSETSSSHTNSSLNLSNQKTVKEITKETSDKEEDFNAESAIRACDVTLQDVTNNDSTDDGAIGDNNNNDHQPQNHPHSKSLDTQNISNDHNIYKQREYEKINSEDVEFNFEAFLNLDPLDYNLMRGGDTHIAGNDTSNISSSRFSRWFVNKAIGDDFKQVQHKSDSRSAEMRSSKDASEMQIQNKKQTNMLMQFLKCNKLPAPMLQDGPHTHLSHAKIASIPSVEELEARMRKIDTDAMNANMTQKTKEEATALQLNIDEITTIGQHQLTSSSAATPTQDMEAFKKLLEQLGGGSSANKQQNNFQINKMLAQQQQHVKPPSHRSTTMPTMHIAQAGAVVAPGLPQTLPPHMLKYEEVKKFLQQQQLIQQQQKHVLPILVPQHTLHQQQPMSPQHLVSNTIINDILQIPPHITPTGTFAGQTPPQMRMEAHHLFQCLARGEISQSFLEQELNTPNITPHVKETIMAVLRESCRSLTPLTGLNVNVSQVPQTHASPTAVALHQQHQLHSPIPLIGPPSQHQHQPVNHNAVISSGIQQEQRNATALKGTGLPSSRDLQIHTQVIMQNALLKKKLEEQQQQQENALKRRQDMQKQQQQANQMIMTGLGETSGVHHQQQHTPSPPCNQQGHSARHINSPTPLAFTPTSVLRKMTADKDNSVAQQQSALSIPQNKQTPSILAHTVFVNHQQQMQQHQQQHQPPPQPRMILGGNLSQQHQQQQHHLVNGGSQISPQTLAQQQQPPPQLPQMRNQPQQQIKWPPTNIINPNLPLNKPMGRPILKGPLLPPTTHQHQQPPQMTFASKIEFQQIQQQHLQQQRMKNNQTPQLLLNSQQPSQGFQQNTQQQPPTPNNIISHVQQQQQIFQHQRTLALQRQQQQLKMQQQLHQQQLIDPSTRTMVGITSTNDANNKTTAGIINYQRDGCLSPTSNQLAQWFSPELLAQASAGKLPPLNVNQALSLEEFERSIQQHSSATVHN